METLLLPKQKPEHYLKFFSSFNPSYIIGYKIQWIQCNKHLFFNTFCVSTATTLDQVLVFTQLHCSDIFLTCLYLWVYFLISYTVNFLNLIFDHICSLLQSLQGLSISCRRGLNSIAWPPPTPLTSVGAMFLLTTIIPGFLLVSKISYFFNTL